MKLYGIPNCETVKKARAWLDSNRVAYDFHDYKKQGADAGRIARWVDEAGWEVVLNRRGTTFRALPDADKADIEAAKAVALMAAHPSCIKRPVVEWANGAITVGFAPDAWSQRLG